MGSLQFMGTESTVAVYSLASKAISSLSSLGGVCLLDVPVKSVTIDHHFGFSRYSIFDTDSKAMALEA